MNNPPLEDIKTLLKCVEESAKVHKESMAMIRKLSAQVDVALDALTVLTLTGCGEVPAIATRAIYKMRMIDKDI
jgi:hypothetical protein